MLEDNIFSFEFHSLVPISDCKTLNDAENSTTLRLFGRTKCFKSVCVNVIAHLPYFFLSPDTSESIDILRLSPFGNENILTGVNVDASSFRVSVVEKKPFYNYYEGWKKFMKIECCSEIIRKRLINLVKDSPNLYYTLYEVSFISFSHILTFLGTCIFCSSIHVRLCYSRDGLSSSKVSDIYRKSRQSFLMQY